MTAYVRYIQPAANGGDDNDSGSTTFEAWATLANLSTLINTTMVNGDTLTVYLEAGSTIPMSANLNSTSVANTTVTFDIYNGLGVTGKTAGPRAKLDWSGGNVNMFTLTGVKTSTAYGFTFNNIEFDGNNQVANIIEMVAGTRCFVTVNNCHFHHASQCQGAYTTKGRGVYVASTTYANPLIVNDSVFEFIGNDAVSLFGSNTFSINRCSFMNIGDYQGVSGGEGDGVTTHTNATGEVNDCYFKNCLQGGCYFTNMGGTSYIRRSFFYQCGAVCVTQSTGGTGTGTGGTLIVSHCIMVQPDAVFQMDDFGNGETQLSTTQAAPCVGLFGTTSAINKDNTLKMYNCTIWQGYRGSLIQAIRVGDVNDAYHVFDMRNCFVIVKVNSTNVSCMRLKIIDSLTTITSDYNTFWCTNTSTPFHIYLGASTATGNFTKWQSTDAVTGGTWKDLDNNSTFYSADADNINAANHIYGLRVPAVAPVGIVDFYLHPLNTSGKIGNTTGVDAGHVPSPSIDGRAVVNTTNNFYRGALGPLRV